MAVASQRQQHAIASTHRLTAPLRGSGHAAQAADTAWALQASCSRLASTFSCHHARPALRSAPFGALLSTESFEDRHRKPHADPCARVRDLVCVFMLGLLVQTSMLGLLAAARAVICCGSTHFKPASHGGSCCQDWSCSSRREFHAAISSGTSNCTWFTPPPLGPVHPRSLAPKPAGTRPRGSRGGQHTVDLLALLS